MSLGKSAQVRSQLKHPIVDGDGHWLETQPIFKDYLAEVGGPGAVDRFDATMRGAAGYSGYRLTSEERMRTRVRRQAWWGWPSRSRDRAAVLVPAVFADSLDEWGIDVALLYPTLGFLLTAIIKERELRQAVVRSYNVMVADMFGPYSDRLIAAGVVSLDSPDEAIEQLEHAHSLGLKMTVSNGTSQRPIEGDAAAVPDAAKRRFYYDGYGLDSPYDYDRVWQRFIDLKMAVTVHTGTMGWPDRSSPTNFVFNHMGHFAQSHHLTARSLFMGGVTDRFPNLNVGFLEGGVGWACNLYADIFGHWKKRNKDAMARNLMPTRLNKSELRELMMRHAGDKKPFAGRIDQILDNNLDVIEPGISQEALTARDIDSDDYSHVRIRDEADIRRLYAKNFYFGCEADDPMTLMAFNRKAGLRLKAVMGSDIGHFDVIDAGEVIEEAWEMVEHELITEDDFREFTFTNVVELHAGMNPDFFKGTRVEAMARDELVRARKRDFTKV
jgi:predicted TIM-barrel fold metal-dependent hydrolase